MNYAYTSMFLNHLIYVKYGNSVRRFKSIFITENKQTKIIPFTNTERLVPNILMFTYL